MEIDSRAVVSGLFYRVCKGGEMYFLTDISKFRFYKKKKVIVIARFHQWMASELQLKHTLTGFATTIERISTSEAICIVLDVFC